MNRERELVQVGCYLRQDQAEERGLVILAMQRPYWILNEEGLYCLYVDGQDSGDVTRELEKFEAEKAEEAATSRQAETEPAAAPAQPHGQISLHVFIWAMLAAFALQTLQGNPWLARGEASSQAIMGGELWRVVTALTLHADLGHLLANVACGLVFAWSLLPLLGSGWTWLGILASGAAGNLLNAFVHGGQPYFSIGASTGVFGGLGLLVGFQIAAEARRQKALRWRSREILLPFAAGLALLAYLGVGGGAGDAGEPAPGAARVDILAHGFGMLCGLGFGALLGWLRLPERTTPRLQKILALAALALPVLAWVWAWL